MIKQDLIGKTFNRLTVIQYQNINNKSYWNCICSCGNHKLIYHTKLITGHTRSCGCLKSDSLKQIASTHGLSRHPLYSVYTDIKTRCYNENDKQFKDYGGRGIKVCDEWLNDFATFHDWCLSNGYAKELQIDRKNNDGNYEPDNCRFVTRSENCNNKRNNKVLYFNNKSLTIAQWAKELKLDRRIIEHRIKRGWSVENTLTRPPKSYQINTQLNCT